MARKIIFFELNEVPFRIVDQFCKWRPGSMLAKMRARCSEYNTFTEDESSLSPWITWPTLHRGVIDQQHMIHEFGQDLSDVDKQFPPIWKLLAANGVSTGICGTLHTYPLPEDLNGYSFFLPDTFAAGSECFPQELSVFQEFNLTMARESARNVSTQVPWQSALRLLANAPGLGLKPKTFMDIGLQLMSERAKRWVKVRRRTYQSVLAFDLFMKQLKREKPAFSSFFTNHVASSMHRFWAAAFPDDYDEFGYDEEWVQTYAREIDFTMSKADDFFKTLVAFADKNPEYQVWVTTSMGQAATKAMPLETQLYIKDESKFMACMGLEPTDWERRPAMLPQYNFMVKPDKIEAFRETLKAFCIDGEPVDTREKVSGFMRINLGHHNLYDKGECTTLRGKAMTLNELGLENVEIQDKSDCSAYHIPEGCLLIYDPKQAPAGNQDRSMISTLEIAPTVLRNFSVPVPDYMKAPATLA